MSQARFIQCVLIEVLASCLDLRRVRVQADGTTKVFVAITLRRGRRLGYAETVDLQRHMGRNIPDLAREVVRRLIRECQGGEGTAQQGEEGT